MPVINLTLGFFAGYAFFLLTSHPKKYKHKLPNIKIGRISVLPCLKIRVRGKQFHLHHWTLLSVVMAALINITGNWFDSYLLLKGVVGGGIIQGLTYADRFKILD